MPRSNRSWKYLPHHQLPFSPALARHRISHQRDHGARGSFRRKSVREHAVKSGSLKYLCFSLRCNIVTTIFSSHLHRLSNNAPTFLASLIFGSADHNSVLPVSGRAPSPSRLSSFIISNKSFSIWIGAFFHTSVVTLTIPPQTLKTCPSGLSRCSRRAHSHLCKEHSMHTRVVL